MLFLTLTSSIDAYSYAAAGKEPTIDAKELIIKAINKDDFDSALIIFNEHKLNYQYLNDAFIDGLYVGLQSAIKEKNKKNIVKYLELSLGAEILRRIDGGYKNIKTFNISKVMLAKANKFYKLLSVSLDAKTDKKLQTSIKACIDSIGNPGLFGVGAKPANEKTYKANQKIIIEIVNSL
jgi:hypothetical protein